MSTHTITGAPQGAPPRPRSWAHLTFALAGRALLHPTLAADLLRVVWNFRARGWYRRFPFLPLPPSEYVRWRMHTAYGDHDAIPPVEDIVRYARWVAGRDQG
ncbi:MAG TPA: hypothetical protein VFS44_03355 [Gemmatimonadaceae bacterium]|nr:hypothetical protein [Gemmatimonadaceae bacterium]